MFVPTNFSDEWESCSEQELWIAFGKDNRKGLSVLFLRFYDRLFRYGMNFSSGEEAVKDGIQKLFFRLWKKRKVLDLPGSVESYLYVSLRRILLRSRESEMARDQRNNEFTECNVYSISSAEEVMIVREEHQERRDLFRKALQTLTPRQKEALLLRLDSGLSNAEIAEIMNVSDKRVRNLIYEATQRLKLGICKLTE